VSFYFSVGDLNNNPGHSLQDICIPVDLVECPCTATQRQPQTSKPNNANSIPEANHHVRKLFSAWNPIHGSVSQSESQTGKLDIPPICPTKTPKLQIDTSKPPPKISLSAEHQDKSIGHQDMPVQCHINETRLTTNTSKPVFEIPLPETRHKDISITHQDISIPLLRPANEIGLKFEIPQPQPQGTLPTGHRDISIGHSDILPKYSTIETKLQIDTSKPPPEILLPAKHKQAISVTKECPNSEPMLQCNASQPPPEIQISAGHTDIYTHLQCPTMGSVSHVNTHIPPPEIILPVKHQDTSIPLHCPVIVPSPQVNAALSSPTIPLSVGQQDSQLQLQVELPMPADQVGQLLQEWMDIYYCRDLPPARFAAAFHHFALKVCCTLLFFNTEFQQNPISM
jgi:hypothetical protein